LQQLAPFAILVGSSANGVALSTEQSQFVINITFNIDSMAQLQQLRPFSHAGHPQPDQR